MTAITIAGLALLAHCVQGQYSCRTPSNDLGKCIPIKSCSHLLASASNPKRTDYELKILKLSHCGFDENGSPKVCCSYTETGGAHECVTLEGNAGICMDIQSCPTLANLLKSPILNRNKEYVNSHRCDDKNENRVCCINCKKILGPPQPRTGCCGIDRGKPDPNKIVTAIDQFPWMVLIEYKDPEYPKEIRFNCAGNIISSRYVLTAAHCVVPSLSRDNFLPVSVRLGEYDTSSDGPDCVETDGGQRECTDGIISIPFDSVIIHHSYKPPFKIHDIALLKLKYEVPYTDFIRPICLPSSDVDEDDTPIFYAAGWGVVDSQKATSKVKLQVDLPLVPLKECNASLGPHRHVSLWEGQICAGGDKGRSTCQGDSGGPLMSYNEFYELIGVISFGRGCGIENSPDVFTKVYQYLPWIRSQIEP